MTRRNRIKQPQGRLVAQTRELLRNTTILYADIYRDTLIQPAWLSQFVNDKIPEPGVNRIETLYNYLSDTPLLAAE